MQVGPHRDGAIHQGKRRLGSERPVPGLHPLDQLVIPSTRRQQRAILDGLGQQFVSHARSDDLHLVPAGLHPDGIIGLGIGDDVVVFAGAGVVAEDGQNIFERVPLLQSLAQQKGHRNALPVAQSPASHLANGHMLGVHPSDRTHEPGV